MKSKCLILSFISLLFFSCDSKDPPKPLGPQPINVFQLKAQTVPIYEEFVGQVYGEKDIPIRTRVEGFLEKISFKEGNSVSKGQLLYTIDDDPFLEAVAAQQSMVSQAKTMLSQKESDLARIKPLAEMNAVSKRDLDMAQAQRDAAISSLEAAHANLRIAEINLGYCKILAPISGIIGRTLAKEGEFVGRNPNPVILNTVSDLRTVRVQFFLSENEYLKVSRAYIKRNNEKIDIDKVNIELELILADGSLYEHKGKLDFMDRNIDVSTGTILLQASFPNPDGFIRPGQFSRVKAKIRDEKNALLIPQKSVIELQGQYSTFIVNSENKIEAKQIKIGEKIGEFWIVKEGLSNNDKVLLEGLQKVRTGLEVLPKITEFNSHTNN